MSRDEISVNISGNKFRMSRQWHQEVDVGRKPVDVVLGETGVELAQSRVAVWTPNNLQSEAVLAWVEQELKTNKTRAKNQGSALLVTS